MRINIEYVSLATYEPCDGCETKGNGFTIIYTYRFALAKLCNTCYGEMVKAFIDPVTNHLDAVREQEERRQRLATQEEKTNDGD